MSWLMRVVPLAIQVIQEIGQVERHGEWHVFEHKARVLAWG